MHADSSSRIGRVLARQSRKCSLLLTRDRRLSRNLSFKRQTDHTGIWTRTSEASVLPPIRAQLFRGITYGTHGNINKLGRLKKLIIIFLLCRGMQQYITHQYISRFQLECEASKFCVLRGAGKYRICIRNHTRTKGSLSPLVHIAIFFITPLSWLSPFYVNEFVSLIKWFSEEWTQKPLTEHIRSLLGFCVFCAHFWFLLRFLFAFLLSFAFFY